MLLQRCLLQHTQRQKPRKPQRQLLSHAQNWTPLKPPPPPPPPPLQRRGRKHEPTWKQQHSQKLWNVRTPQQLQQLH